MYSVILRNYPAIMFYSMPASYITTCDKRRKEDGGGETNKGEEVDWE